MVGFCVSQLLCTWPTVMLRIYFSINFLHLRRFVSGPLDLFKWWKVVVIAEALVVVVDAETQLDHAMNAASKLSWLVKVEARGQQRCVEEEPNQILHSLVGLVRSCLLLQLGHDGMLGVHFHGLLRHHVGCHATVTQCLRLHDTLHVCRPSILRCCQHTRRISQS